MCSTGNSTVMTIIELSAPDIGESTCYSYHLKDACVLTSVDTIHEHTRYPITAALFTHGAGMLTNGSSSLSAQMIVW